MKTPAGGWNTRPTPERVFAGPTFNHTHFCQHSENFLAIASGKIYLPFAPSVQFSPIAIVRVADPGRNEERPENPPHAVPTEIPKPGETSEPTNPSAPGCNCNDPCKDCGGQETHAPGCDNSTHPSSSYSDHPVRYANGEVYMVTEDLSFKSFGLDWGHTRSYSNRVTEPNTGRNGNSWFVKE